MKKQSSDKSYKISYPREVSAYYFDKDKNELLKQGYRDLFTPIQLAKSLSSMEVLKERVDRAYYGDVTDVQKVDKMEAFTNINLISNGVNSDGDDVDYSQINADLESKVSDLKDKKGRNKGKKEDDQVETVSGVQTEKQKDVQSDSKKDA